MFRKRAVAFFMLAAWCQLLVAGAGPDFNKDGKTDILWRNGTTGENYVWYIAGAAQVGGAPMDPVGDLTWAIMPQVYPTVKTMMVIFSNYGPGNSVCTTCNVWDTGEHLPEQPYHRGMPFTVSLGTDFQLDSISVTAFQSGHIAPVYLVSVKTVRLSGTPMTRCSDEARLRR